MESLAKWIFERLEINPQCSIFGYDVEREWPILPSEIEKRDNAIHAFARKHGLKANIRDSGIRVFFTKLKS